MPKGLFRKAGLQTYDCGLEIKSVEDDGMFTGYASVFTKDQDGDVIVKGAFKRTIQQKGGRVPILWQHDKTKPIGVNYEMKEDDHGLWVRGQLNLETQLGREARSLIKQGAMKGLSIGFYISAPPEFKDNVRYIKEVKLVEYSVVTFPAHEDAQVDQMKGGHIVTGANTKGSTNFTDVLAQCQAEDDLWEERGMIEDSIRQTVRNIIGDGDADDDDAISNKQDAINAITAAYTAYGEAMVGWWSKYIDAMRMVDDEAKSANTDPESKAAKTVASAMRQIVTVHSAAMKSHQKAQTLHQKALDMAHLMAYTHLIRADQYTPANPMPKGNGNPPPTPADEHLPDQNELKDLAASLRLIKFNKE